LDDRDPALSFEAAGVEDGAVFRELLLEPPDEIFLPAFHGGAGELEQEIVLAIQMPEELVR
jgi:hypothetical protein